MSFPTAPSAMSSHLRPRPSHLHDHSGSVSPRPSSAVSGLPTSPTSMGVAGGVTAAGPGAAGSSRRSSSVSSIGAVSKSRSLLSNGAGTAEGPVIEGNLQVLTAVDCGDSVLSFQNTENGAAFVCGLFGGILRVVSATSGTQLLSLEPTFQDPPAAHAAHASSPSRHSGLSLPTTRVRVKPHSLDAQPTSLAAATYADGHLRIWNYASGQLVAQTRDDDPLCEYLCVSHNPFVDVLAVGTDSGAIKLVDERTLQVVSLLQRSMDSTKHTCHSDRVLCIANHPMNPHEFVSAGWDNTLQFWDARSPNSVRSVLGFFVCGEGLAFDRRGKELAVASWRPNNQLQILDYDTGLVLADMDMGVTPAHNPHYLTCVKYLGRDHLVAGGTNRGVVRVVDRARKCVVASVRDLPPVYDVQVVRKSQTPRFAVTNNNSVVVIEFNK